LSNDRLQNMLSEFRRALYDAISDSTDVHRTWRQLREEGYSLFLLVDCKRHSGNGNGQEGPEPVERGKLPVPPQEPVFQINGSDLGFLRSIGIDPTRRARRRAPSPQSSS
jgi:hypothetical protein